MNKAKELLFATHNDHKAEEIRYILKEAWTISTLKDIGWKDEIPEPHGTLEENATEKSRRLYELTGRPCFSEDSGLEVEALQGEPGVRTARYAGEPVSHQRNIELLLKNLEGIQNRKARFRTVISLMLEGKEYQFEGICSGDIAVKASGTKGFGYDPVFIPSGEQRTFAEMTLEEKTHYSHRRKALDKLIQHLQQQNVTSDSTGNPE